MEIRVFQIVVPLIALLFVISFITRYLKAKASIRETVFSIVFWLGIGIFAIIPDLISNFIASLFGIKSNINAIIFLSLGVLTYTQFRMYNLIKDQQLKLTELTRQLAIKEFENQEQV
ncbi:MAG: DUF2304 domain-containing protein [Bacteroidota bacterium]